MTDQSIGPDAPADGVVYLMAKPGEVAGRRLEQVGLRCRREGRLSGRPTPWDRLHATLVVLHLRGEAPAQAAAVDAAMAGLRTPPFRAVVDRVVSWTGEARRPMVATADDGVVGLFRLHDAIISAFEAARVRYVRRSFTPHVTLLRDPKAVEETFITPIAWTVDEVQLVFSIVEQRRHVVLRRWALRG